MTSTSPIRHVADLMVTELAGYPLNEWLLDRADEGKSLREIASELHQLTGGVLVVSHTTVGNWLRSAQAQGGTAA